MNDHRKQADADLVDKIARLVEQRGWNQEDFARAADLNRLTVRRILQRREDARLRNSTVGRCARALGLPVDDLRSSPIARLLARRAATASGDADARSRRLHERPMHP